MRLSGTGSTNQRNLQLGKKRDKRLELETVGRKLRSSSMDFFLIL